jgi:predicted ATP-dependent endonuclease of OLD family
MRIKSVELKEFKRFTHLPVEGLPETAKPAVLVGPNSSEKPLFLKHLTLFTNYPVTKLTENLVICRNQKATIPSTNMNGRQNLLNW